MKRLSIICVLVFVIGLSALLIGPARVDHESSPAFLAALKRAIEHLEGVSANLGAGISPQSLSAQVSPDTTHGMENTVDDYTCAQHPACAPTAMCTLDPSEYTCEGNPACMPHTAYQHTCYGTDITCEGYTCSETCQYSETCEGYVGETCDDQPTSCVATCAMQFTCSSTCEGLETCYPQVTCQSYTCSSTCCGQPGCGITCNSGYTCDGSGTCDAQSATCTYTCRTWPTCQPNEQCMVTIDGTATCDGTPTCTSTCSDEWPTCGTEATCEGSTGYTCDSGDPSCCQGVQHTSWGRIKLLLD